MKIKNLISLLLVLVMCLGFCAFPVGASAYDVSGEAKLYALGILDKQADDLKRPVTRMEMVKYAVRLYGKDVALSGGKTPFADVPAEHEAAGAVNFAVAKNIISAQAMFYPDRTVRYEEAVKMIVTALEFGDVASLSGGYPNGFLSVASEIGLLKNISVNAGDGLTLKTVAELLDNALSCVVANPTLVYNNKLNKELIISDTSSKETVLVKRFNISKYDAFISDYSASTGIIKAQIKSNDKNNDMASYKAGDTAILTAGAKASIGDIKYTLSTIYVNDADELIFAETDKNIEVVTGHIYEINESHNNADHYPSYIYNVAFEDTDDYIDVSSECQMFFNGDAVNEDKAYPYISAFARAVIYKDEIIALEAWSLNEGGMITSVGDNDIQYIKGETPVVYFNGVTDYKDVAIYINGLKSELWALTSGVVFDWYGTDDKESLIIVASSRAITDEFETMTDSKLKIGGDEYPLSEIYDVYSSQEGENYKNTQNLSLLLGRTVTAYIDFAGYVRYIRPVLEDELSKEYYGLIMGYKENGLDAPTLQVYTIIDGKAEKNEYALTEKTAAQKSSDLDEIKRHIKKLKNAEETKKLTVLRQADVVYKIRVNDKNEITSLSKATLFSEPVLNEKYEKARADAEKAKEDPEIGYLVTDLTSIAKAQTSNPRVYFENAVICALYYDEDGDLTVRTVPWDSLKARSGSNIFLTPYAAEGSSDVELMLIRGDVEIIGHTRVEYVKRGMATDVSVGYNKEKDKEVINVRIGGNQYSISKFKDKFEGVTDAAYIIYSTDNPFLPSDEIKLNYVFNLSGAPDTWETVAPRQEGVHRDEALKIDDKRVYLESGDVWYMATDAPVYELVETNGKTKFIESHRGNVQKGADVWYVYYNYEIRALFYR